MTPRFKFSKEETIYFFLSSILFIYLLIRANYVPFTHDEAATFFRFVQIHSLDPEFSREALNNHFLNTILTYLSYLVFDSSKIALRLPNVLMSLVYLVFVYKLASFLVNSVYRWGFIIVLLFTHFFVEFFAVSRGYGMSMAFFMAAYYYLIKAISTEKLINNVYVALFGLLMVAANINMVIPSIAILLLQVLSISFQRKDIPSGKIWMIPLFLIISIGTITTAFLYLNELKEYDAFYLVSENNGFVDSTIVTLMSMLTGSTGLFGTIVLLVLSVLVVIIAIRQLIRLKLRFLISVNSAFLFVLVMTLTGIFLVVYLFGVNFPEDRVAMYLFPLAVGSLFFVFDSVKGRGYRYLYLILIPLLFSPIHFVSSINVSYVNGYNTEALPDRFYQTIALEHAKSNKLPTIGGSNMRQFAWAYINYLHDGNENSIDWAGYPDTVSLFQILETERYPYNLITYDSIDHEPYSGLTLYKRKREVSKAKVKEISFIEPQNIVGNEYFNLLVVDVDSIVNRGYYFEFSISIVTAHVPFTGWLVIQVVNSEQSTIVYKYVPLNWLKHGLDNTVSNFRQNLFLEKLPEDAKTIKMYIWNLDKKTYTLNSAHVDMFELR